MHSRRFRWSFVLILYSPATPDSAPLARSGEVFAGWIGAWASGVFFSFRLFIVFHMLLSSTSAAAFVASYPLIGFSGSRHSGGGSLLAGSAALARALAASGRVLVSFPSGACPSGVRVSRSFRGFGSGSWGTLALALGLGVPVLAFVPCVAGVPWSMLGPVAGRFVVAPFGSSSSSGCWVWGSAAGVVQGVLF